MKRLLLALLVVALLAAPAFASVQNIKISGDIDSTWLVRDKFDFGDVDSDSQYQNLLITQTRLRVDADLTDNVSATVALINERVWGEEDESTDDSDLDLNLAYVTLREMLYSPLTVIIGRQAFAFGNSFVIDSAGTNNTVSTGGLVNSAEDFSKRTAVDAVRLILDYNPLTIDLVAAKLDADNTAATAAEDDDMDLFGINTNYQLGDDMDSVVEGYFWARIDQRGKDGNAGAKGDTVYMPGMRASSNLLKGLMVSGEVAWQFGNDWTTGATNVAREAMAAQGIASYLLPFEKTAEYNPVITTAYTYVSGDSEDTAAGFLGTEKTSAWDPMLENQSGGKIYNTLFNLSNSHIITLKAEAKPMQDVTAYIEWDRLWLDKELEDGDENGNATLTVFDWRGSDGAGTSLNGSDDTLLGDEFGMGLVYDYTEDVQIGGSLRWFFPGKTFGPDNDDAAFQSIVNANVAF